MRGATMRMQGCNGRQSSCSQSVSVKLATALRDEPQGVLLCASPRLGRGTRVGVRYCPLLESIRTPGLSVISRNDRSPHVFQNTNHSGGHDNMQFQLDHVMHKHAWTQVRNPSKLVVTSLQLARARCPVLAGRDRGRS
ncbi:hypothetical protein SVAN01_06284 [Stagonosporopsis vannaccii]|nr:hypothetical protein SVAN01_06284 [Stagonosporopsis vannaccii]